MATSQDIIKKVTDLLDKIAEGANIAKDVFAPVVGIVSDAINTLKDLGKSDDELTALLEERLAVLDAAIAQAVSTDIHARPGQ